MTRTIALNEADHARVSDAVRAAESGTAGEIVTIVADASDRYQDVALWWSVSAAIVAVAALAAFPGLHQLSLEVLTGGWVTETTPTEALTMALATFVLKFAAVRLMLLYRPLLLALTPRAIRADRVHRRAVRYFKVGAEARTRDRTGILIYLSLAEHRAEIVADSAIHSQVAPGSWGEAMTKLVAFAKDGRIADGMIAAITDIGAILSTHLPRAADDLNELPDRLIEL